MSVLYLLQFYFEYLGPSGSMSVVSLAHTGSDLLCCSAALLAIGMWATSTHFRGGLCPSISMALTSCLSYSVGASLATTCTMVLLELYKPTFGKKGKNKLADGDIKMPADGYCLYHCFNYQMSDGAAPLTKAYAMRLNRKIRPRISAEAGRMRIAGLLTEADALSKQAARLSQYGSAGYPDEEDFAYFVAEAGFSFAIVQDIVPEPLVYGSELGPVCLTVRRHYVKDGEGHPSPHYDVISYVAPTFKTYEKLGSKLLDGYTDFLCSALCADRTIGTTALTEMLEAEHGVSAAVSTIRYWRGRESIKQHIASMARLQLSDALDTYDVMIDSMGPAVITIDEPIDPSVGANDTDVAAATGDGFITEVAMEGNNIPDSPIVSGEAITIGFVGADGAISDGAITDGVPIDLAAGAMDLSPVGIGAMTDSANGAIAGGALAAGGVIDANISMEPPLAAATGSIKRSPKRARSFYGPNIHPGEAFTSAVAGPAPMAPLPEVKPKDYEEFLQGHLNAHPTITDGKLLKALEDSMHVTCRRQGMRTWLDHHAAIVADPDIADHEEFL